jgi:hypothetical protein
MGITPTAGQKLVLDGHWGFDNTALTGETNADTTIDAYAGNQVIIEGLLFDGGTVSHPAETAHGNLGSTHTIDFNAGHHQSGTLTAACTLTLTAPANGPMTGYFTVTQDGTGAWDFVYPGATTMPGKVKPAITQAANAVSLLMFYWNGSVWRVGLAMADIGVIP